MRRAKRLHGGDARHHAQVQGQAAPDALGDAQGAVVKRRIAPDQQRGPLRTVLADDLFPAQGDGIVPVLDALTIAVVAVAAGHLEPGQRRWTAQHLTAQHLAQLTQIGLVLALGGDQDQVRHGHHRDRLARQVAGAAGADADQRQLDHGASPIR